MMVPHLCPEELVMFISSTKWNQPLSSYHEIIEEYMHLSVESTLCMSHGNTFLLKGFQS